MRVLFLAQELPTRGSPDSGRFIIRHLEVLRMDHSVTAVHLAVRNGVPRRATISPPDEAGVHTCAGVGPLGARDVAMALVLRGLATTHDVIHTNALEAARVGYLLSRWTATPWLHSEHSSDWTDPAGRGLAAVATAMTRSAALQADIITTVSRYLGAAIERRTGVAPRVVPNTIAVPTALSVKSRREFADRIRIVSTGALIESKGPILAARAVAALSRLVDARVEWTWIGRGPLLAPLQAEVEALGIRPQTKILAPMEPDGYWRATADHDFFFLPTKHETFSVVAAEALALGLPVVMGPRGGHLEFVGPPHGIISAEHTVDAYVEALLSMVHSFREIEPAACRAAVERFDPEAVRAAMAAAYSGLPSGRHAAPGRRAGRR